MNKFQYQFKIYIYKNKYKDKLVTNIKNIMESEYVNKLKESIEKTKEWIELNKNDIYRNKYYYYYSVNNHQLLKQIRLNYSKWKKICESESDNKYTLLREVTVSQDTDDYNFFVIADTNFINK